MFICKPVAFCPHMRYKVLVRKAIVIVRSCVMREGTVRPIAICIFRKDDCILVGEGYDAVKQETFFRPLGGSIEFGEHSSKTIVREIKEELGADIVNVSYQGTLEDIFICDAEPGHEIIMVYQASFADRSFYDKECIEGVEGSLKFRALWKPFAYFADGKVPLYPDGLLEMLLKSGCNETK
jgi:8-oxo-dGTP pyrophosphatase MutT (NUDIX family)